MPRNWPFKDPDEVLDYTINWADRLAAAETISSSAWTVPTGITEDSDSNTTTTTTIWLSGGTLGETYDLVNHIVTSAGREFDLTARIRILAR